MALERRSAKNLKEAFRETYETLYPGASTFEDVMQQAAEVERLAKEDAKIKDAVARMLLEGVDLGVSVSVQQLGPIGFDWTLTNIAARDWAAEHTGTLIRGINETTLRGVRQATARWIENGEPLQKLIDDIEPFFGKGRSERIAVTEITNAFATANKIAYQESGVCQGWEWRVSEDERVCSICGPLAGKRRKFGEPFVAGIMQPAAHVRCRCWVVPWLL